MIASPEVVSPVLKAKRSIPKQKSRNKGDTLILTSTPVKMKLSLRKVKPVRPSPERRKKRQVPDKLVVSRKIKCKKILRPIESAESRSSCEEIHGQLQENFKVHTSDQAESE